MTNLCTWCESDAFFNRKLIIKWQGLRSALLAYNFCHHICSYNIFWASRKWSLTKLWFTKQHKNFGVPFLILNHEKKLFWTFFLLPMLKYGLIRPYIINFCQNWNFVFQVNCSSLCVGLAITLNILLTWWGRSELEKIILPIWSNRLRVFSCLSLPAILVWYDKNDASV